MRAPQFFAFEVRANHDLDGLAQEFIAYLFTQRQDLVQLGLMRVDEAVLNLESGGQGIIVGDLSTQARCS